MKRRQGENESVDYKRLRKVKTVDCMEKTRMLEPLERLWSMQGVSRESSKAFTRKDEWHLVDALLSLSEIEFFPNFHLRGTDGRSNRRTNVH